MPSRLDMGCNVMLGYVTLSPGREYDTQVFHQLGAQT